MHYAFLRIDFLEAGIAQLSLNRPEAANALTAAMALELKEVFSSLPVRAAILCGVGKHFCAGADLKERDGMGEEAWKTQHQAFREARDAILACPVPVIAAIQGAAYGGGLELALACDFIYAAKDARFALTEASLGIMPGMGGTVLLPRTVGARRAKEILYCAAPFSAEEAYGWGIVNRLCDVDSLHETTLACAKTIAANAPLSIQSIKKSVDGGKDQPLAAALAEELSLYNRLLSSQDRREGIASWNEKRKPQFTGN